MTLVDRQPPSTTQAPPAAPAVQRAWWSRAWNAILNAIIPGRRAAQRRHEQMLEFARQNPPPQRWHDEDFTSLRTPRQS